MYWHLTRTLPLSLVFENGVTHTHRQTDKLITVTRLAHVPRGLNMGSSEVVWRRPYSLKFVKTNNIIIILILHLSVDESRRSPEAILKTSLSLDC